MKRELAYLSTDPLQVFEYWDRIPDGVYKEWDGGGWLHEIFSDPVQTRCKKGNTLSIYNGRKGFFSSPEYTYFKEDSKTIKVFKGDKTFFSDPVETYVITTDRIEIYDGNNGIFSSPKKVIQRNDDESENDSLALLGLLGLVLFGVG